MAAPQSPMLPHHHEVVQRFVAACEADERVAAAFLGGSYAAGTTDAYSDLDLYIITTDEAHDDFLAGSESFVERLGEPVFLLDAQAQGADNVCFMLADGTECDLGIGRAGRFMHLHGGPHRVLVDKSGILADMTFPRFATDPTAQRETLRGLIWWFWHDLRHHFLTPLARGQVWSAYGGLEDLRSICVNLARLAENFSAKPEGYERVEHFLPAERLAPLQTTFCPLEHDAMLHAARVLVQFYEQVAPPLAQAHGIPYPTAVARTLTERLRQMA
jgi:Streptomycin adenylyltransferase